MTTVKIFDRKTLNPQYIIDEAGNKNGIILPLFKFDELMNSLTALVKLLDESRETIATAPVEKLVSNDTPNNTLDNSMEAALAKQRITMLTQHYDFLSKTLATIQQYPDLKTELERKIHQQKLLTSMETETQVLRQQITDFKKKTKPAEVYNVPELAKNIVPNTVLFNELKTKILAEVVNDQKWPILLEGLSGVGKSTLVASLAWDEEIRQAFPDGIFWIGLGKEPPVLEDQIWLIQTLEESSINFVEVEAANEYLRQSCTSRAALIILDDVWEVQDLLAFNLASEHSQLFIVTKDSNLLNITQYFIPNVQGYVLKPFTEKQAIEFFLRYIGKKEITAANAPVKLDELVRLSECLPASLKLLAALLRNQPISTWQSVLERMRSDDYDFPPSYPRALMQALHFNVEALGEQADYYLSLAVFFDYTRIPQATVIMLWRYLYQLMDDQANNFIKELVDKGLLDVKGKPTQRYISLQSLQHDYLCAEAEVEKLHNHLLAAYRRQCGQHGWLSGPNDGYFFQYLAMHLVKSGRKNELKLLLLDFDWMQKKLQVGTVQSFLHDYELLEDRDVTVIKTTLYEAAAILLDNKSELAVQLLDRLWGEKSLQNNRDIQALLNQAKETLPNWVWQPHFEAEAKK